MADNYTFLDSAEVEKTAAAQDIGGGVLAGKVLMINTSGEQLSFSPLLDISRGLITGLSYVNKFGRADDVDTGNYSAIWDGKRTGGDYPNADYTTPSNVGTTFYISSSDNSDTQTYEVQGLDANFDPQTITVTNAGNTVTPIISGGTEKWTRVFRIKNTGTTDNAGIIFVASEDNHTSGVPDDSAKIVGMISIEKNQTLMAIYTVPNGKTAYMLRNYISCGRGEDFEVEMLARSFGGVWQVKDHQHLYQMNIQNSFTPYPKFTAKTDIKVMAKSLSTTDKPVSAGFDLILVDD